jgi:hypothetical protein
MPSIVLSPIVHSNLSVASRGQSEKYGAILEIVHSEPEADQWAGYPRTVEWGLFLLVNEI